MRAHHASHSLPSFPIYSAGFVSDTTIVLGGGGGNSRTGIKNKLRMYDITNDETINLVGEVELGKGEDAPMSMATDTKTSRVVCGVNSTEEAMKEGNNQNCRLYKVEEENLHFVKSTNTLSTSATELEDFQKVTVLSRDLSLAAVAGNRTLSVLSYPELTAVSEPLATEHDIYDATFSSKELVVATTSQLLVYEIPTKGDKSTSKLKSTRTVARPTFPGSETCTFRAARFSPVKESQFYAAVNTVPQRMKGKAPPKKGYIYKYDSETWEVIISRKVGERGITCLDLSPDGALVAFGSADCTVGILDSQTLAPLVSILKAHDFPPTTLRFNPTSKLLVSGSADNSIRVVTVPSPSDSSTWSTLWLIVLAILATILAFTAQVVLTKA